MGEHERRHAVHRVATAPAVRDLVGSAPEDERAALGEHALHLVAVDAGLRPEHRIADIPRCRRSTNRTRARRRDDPSGFALPSSGPATKPSSDIDISITTLDNVSTSRSRPSGPHVTDAMNVRRIGLRECNERAAAGYGPTVATNRATPSPGSRSRCSERRVHAFAHTQHRRARRGDDGRRRLRGNTHDRDGGVARRRSRLRQRQHGGNEHDRRVRPARRRVAHAARRLTVLGRRRRDRHVIGSQGRSRRPPTATGSSRSTPAATRSPCWRSGATAR